MKKAVDLVESKQGLSSQELRDRGRVDYVRVEDWGGGQPGDLGELKLAAAPEQLAVEAPFYDVLARHLEALQAEGALAVARPPGAPPLPPFERWAFAESHYQQHLADLLCVHSAIEDVHETMCGTLKPTKSTAGVAEALIILGPAAGLARSACVERDAAAMCNSSAGDSGSASVRPDPSPNAATYAQYIRDLGARCGRADSEAELADVAVR